MVVFAPPRIAFVITLGHYNQRPHRPLVKLELEIEVELEEEVVVVAVVLKDNRKEITITWRTAFSPRRRCGLVSMVNSPRDDVRSLVFPEVIAGRVEKRSIGAPVQGVDLNNIIWTVFL
ncbi:hypothetical protein DPMN_033419 [Dreissena polymorpha]|uniref:Uncharacterized protein n=1 Tax=Dreissena polymorpha TaxID=45954 RepID=A0A9D4M6Z4_DREPO|nr:hypothetical protein DPMN_033419 [Dreissena polymorpha]